MSLTSFSVKRPVSITMIAFIVVVIGFFAVSKIGLDLMPDIDFPTVSVITRYEGASSEDIEKLVTRPVEGAASGVNGVTSVKSMTREDMSYVLVNFEYGTNLDEAAADLRDAIGLVENILPEDADKPLVVKFSLTALPVLSWTVSGMGGDVVALGRFLDDDVAQRLERIDGVAQAVVLGGPTLEVHVEVDRAALEASGLPMDQVVQAIGAQNVDQPGGRVVERQGEYIVRTLGAYRDLRDIEQSMVGVSRSGDVLKVRDLATVTATTADVRNIFRANGEPALYVMVMKQSNANPLQVARLVKTEVARLQEALPGSIDFSPMIDLGMQIQTMSDSVTESGVVGGLLAIVFMWLFLRSMRPTLAIAVTVPLSLLATFIPMYFMGETLNLMTMGGLMLGVGMLVDNSVIVIENIFRHLENGMERKEAAMRGAAEMGLPIIASTLTTVAVFVPMFFGGGLAGELVRGLAVVVAISQTASLLVALTIVPMLAAVLFDEGDARHSIDDRAWYLPMKNGYVSALRWVMGHRKTTVGIVLALIVGSVAVVPVLGATFLPGSDQPVVMGRVVLPVGTPMDEAQAALHRVEEFARSLPDVETAGVSIGANEDDLGAGMSEMSASGVHEAQLFVRFADNRKETTKDLLERLRTGTPRGENMVVEWMDMGDAMMGGGGQKPIQVELYGDDLNVLGRLADRVTTAMRGVEGLTEIDSSIRTPKPERHLVIDRERASSFGLTVAEIARAVDAATRGTIAGLYRENGEESLIRVRYREEDRQGFDALDRILVPTRAGTTIPLRQVARFETGIGPTQIDRAEQSRKVAVRANLQGRDLGSVVADVDDALESVRAELPMGYRIEFGGTYEDMVDAFVTLAQAFALAVLLVYMVMASQFEAFAQPFVLMITVPLAWIGVALGLLVTGTPVSAATFVGVIILAGIVVNNGIVLVDFINQMRAEGLPRGAAILEAGGSRLRPVLMTTGTAVVGLIPSAVWGGRGSELTADLAKTLIGGLTVSTLLTLLVVPILYEFADDAGTKAVALWNRLLHGRKEAVVEEAEPA